MQVDTYLEENEVFAFAKNPVISEKSEFITDIERWVVLWLYVCETATHIFNEFKDDVSEEEAIQLANFLQEKKETGHFQKWVVDWESNKQDEWRCCTLDDLNQFIDFCGLSGGFRI